ncbi:MAG: tRNA (guanosine(46)-N7)-methyltransferase TrmB [Oscillospiraceae bacterium]|nr:tRNA (guanosine(46)-N7)-methyltransferase TrmB [Oscillospiraceae bacterium]
MRMRKKRHLDSRIEKCADFLVADPTSMRDSWLAEGQFSEVYIELGCGKGRFIAEMAKCAPDVLFVGAEKAANVLVIALERAMNEGISNVRFINGLADHLDAFFAPGEVSGIFLNFSDPWPTLRHAKRRLTSPVFLDLYRKVLRPGGEIQLKTDNYPLFEYSLDEFRRAGFTVLSETCDLHRNGLDGIMTEYEMKFHEQGVPINKCVVRV